MRKILIYFSLILFVSCSVSNEDKDITIFKNASFYNDEYTNIEVQSIAVEDGIIIEIGDFKNLESKYQSAEIIDLDSSLIFPGFNDAHCHFFGYAFNLAESCDLTDTKSLDEIITRLKIYDEKYNPDFIYARGWDQNDWENTEMPDWTELNKTFPEKPVLLIRIDGHAALINEKAAEIAGITPETVVEGGEIVTQDGKLTGLLIDMAIEKVRIYLPDLTFKQVEDAIMMTQDSSLKYGLTSLTDAGLDKKQIMFLDSLQKAGDLKIRINAMLSPSEDNFEYFENEFESTDLIKISSVKLFSDGALGSRGACLLNEYSDVPGRYGFIIEEVDYYKEVCQYAYDHNLQVCTHCIGDSANRLMLDIYYEFLQGENDRRWRIEHAQVVNEKDIDKFGKYSIIPSIQSTHATSDMYWAEARLGSERINHAYQTRRLLDQNGWLPNGTDFPVEDISPIETFYAAIFRQDKKYYPEGGFLNSQCLTRQEALKSITFWPAMASFDEIVKGKIKEGMYADFIILDRDIIKCSKEDVLEAKVLQVWIGGEKVWGGSD